VNNLLDVRKVSSGTVEVSMEEVDARTFFNRIWLSCEEIIKKKGLTAELIDIEWIPERLILDTHRLTQILFNLIGNAVKFTKKGSVKLKLNWIPERTMSQLPEIQPRVEHIPSLEEFMNEQSVSQKMRDKMLFASS
jgi:signal transduction histidine kinase